MPDKEKEQKIKYLKEYFKSIGYIEKPSNIFIKNFGVFQVKFKFNKNSLHKLFKSSNKSTWIKININYYKDVLMVN